jgi:hypothetical protein
MNEQHETRQAHMLSTQGGEEEADPILEKMNRADSLVRVEGIMLKDALKRVGLNPTTYYGKRRRLRLKEGIGPRPYIKRRPYKKKSDQQLSLVKEPDPAPTTPTPPRHRIDYHLHEQPKKKEGIVILMGDGEEIRKTMELAMLYKKEIG